jgi:hypothetical protein
MASDMGRARRVEAAIGVILLDRKQAEPVWRDPQVALAQAEYRITGDGRSLRVGVVETRSITFQLLCP